MEPDIDEQTWQRFRWYARLVHEVQRRISCEDFLVHRSVWDVLATRLAGEPLLPSLRRLRIPMGMDDLAPFVFLLSPSIRSLVFEPYGSTAMWARGTRESYKSLLHIISSPIVRHCFASCTPEHSNGLEPLGSVCDLNVYISITYLLIDICGRTAPCPSSTLYLWFRRYEL